MKNAAQITKNILLAVVLIALAALAFSKNAWAASGNVQICQQNGTCTVGEFLYNDSYAPIANASCHFSSKYPNGDPFVNYQLMVPAPEDDGWYSYDVVATGSAGLYRSTICCQDGTDYLCLDKSFEIATASSTLTKIDVADSVWNATRSSYTANGSFGQALQNTVPSASDIAAAIWGYEGRTLSTFGSLVSDIWNNSTRSLTGFGTLVADIWSNTTRVLTGASLSSGSLATKTDVEDKVNAKTQELKNEIAKISTNSADLDTLKRSSQKTNNLLEQLVNKPVVETTLQDVPDLQVKLNETEGTATQLFVGTQYINSKAGLMRLQWNSFENSEALDIAQELTRKLGGENDSSSSGSVFGYINFLKESWNWSPVEAIVVQAKAVREVLASIQNQIESSGRSKSTYNKVTALASLLDQLDNSIGDISNKSTQETLFGKLKETRLLANSLDKIDGDTKALLSGWDKYQLADKQKKLSGLSKEVVTVNRIPSINKALLSVNSTLEKELKNKGYFVLGIISANKKLLAGKSGLPLASTWLELGSIVFKSLVTNPSTVISQKATLKYYLPPEVKEEDIIEADSGLTVKYDTEKNQYYVSGEFLLAPSETQTISVRTQDIWIINQEEIDSLRKQAEELSKPLEKTSYFAQGVTMKSDIDVSLDKAIGLMKSNDTLEAKIRAYREAQIELKAVRGKMDKLKELVTQAGSTGTLFGFVGGVQTLAVWGMIIILIVGFVFLALYMKVLTNTRGEGNQKASSSQRKKPKSNNQENVAFGRMPKFRYAFTILLFFGIGSGLAAGVILGRTGLAPKSQPEMTTNQVQDITVLSASASASQADTKPVATPSAQIEIIVPLGSWVNVRSEPSLSSLVISRVEQTAQFTELDRQNGWVNISIDVERDGESYDQGWVSEKFAPKEIVQEINSQAITINDTPTGFLRVRQSPWGQEVAQVHPGDNFVPIEEKENWFQIELQDGVIGWIYGEYVTKDNS